MVIPASVAWAVVIMSLTSYYHGWHKEPVDFPHGSCFNYRVNDMHLVSNHGISVIFVQATVWRSVWVMATQTPIVGHFRDAHSEGRIGCCATYVEEDER